MNPGRREVSSYEKDLQGYLYKAGLVECDYKNLQAPQYCSKSLILIIRR